MKQILYVLLAACVFFGCSKDKEETPVGGIAGSVSDKTTGEPVATANVKLNTGESTVTGSDGSFAFTNLSPYYYDVTITKEGYRSTEYTVEVVAGSQLSNHLLLERLPAIVTANPATLEFGENVSNTTLSFTILNPSYDDLDWQIETDCNWITVKPASGSLKYGKTETIVVTIDRTQLNSNSQYNGTDYESVIVVTSSDGNAEIKVKAIGKYHKNPEFNILETTKVLATSATLNGMVSYGGEPQYYERGFVYHTEPSPTLENNIERLKVQGTNNKNYSYGLANLTPNTIYYARAYVITSYGVYYSSNEIRFMTKKTDLRASVQRPTEVNLSAGTAVFHGTVIGERISYSERGFVYGTSTNPTIEEDAKVIAGGYGSGEYSARASDLSLKQIYYVRAYVLVNDDIVYSDSCVTFSTMPVLPEVTTEEPSDVDMSAGIATLRGTIVSVGEPAYSERGFAYATMPNPTIYDNKIVANGMGVATSFSTYITELPKETTWYIRAYATNQGGTVYGKEVEVSSLWEVLSSAGIAVQKTDIGRGDKSSAEMMCKNSTLGGHSDWRLPTKDELMVLYNERIRIGDFSSGFYWSSSTYTHLYNYYLNFETGKLYCNSDNDLKSIRCVRSLK